MFKESIGQNIKKFRINKKGWTQKELAKESEITRESIGNYERGDRTPPADILNKIAKALDVSIDDLIGYTEVKKIADAEKIPDWELMITDDGIDESVIDSEFIKKYKFQIMSFKGVIDILENVENLKLINLFHDIIKNINRLLEDMMIENEFVKILNESDEKFIEKFDLSKYDLLYSCLKKSKGDKEKLLENLEELQFLFFESRYDKIITDLKTMKDNYLKMGNAFKRSIDYNEQHE